MYCWSCGSTLASPGRPCANCGAQPPSVTRPATVPTSWSAGPPAHIRSCPACGFRGDGIPYFRRAGHAALLVAATIFTYGVGGVVFWLLKKNERICPSCGISWNRSRAVGGDAGAWAAEGVSRSETPAAASGGNGGAGQPPLPGSGIGRRVLGALVALIGLLVVGIGVVELEQVAVVVGGTLGLTGATTFGWGWRALQRRREAVFQRMQRDVLRLARGRQGRLTASDVAAEMDLSLQAAERILLSLDDGFRIRSDVSDDGILYFDFPELRLPLDRGGGLRSAPETPLPE